MSIRARMSMTAHMRMRAHVRNLFFRREPARGFMAREHMSIRVHIRVHAQGAGAGLHGQGAYEHKGTYKGTCAGSRCGASWPGNI
jgi:hypothetical protein